MFGHNVLGESYQCLTTIVTLTSGNTVTNVTGTHMSGRNNNDVKGIYIVGNRILNFVPQGFINFFPNTDAINIHQTAITELHGDEFNEFPDLEYLTFDTSNLTTISSRLFENTPKMRLVRFRTGMLERVGRDLFTPINVTQLEWVAFTNHPCINRNVNNRNQTAIIALINELQENCSFDDEFLTTTTENNLTCSERRIEDVVCDLKDEMKEVQNTLTDHDEKINNLKREFELKIRSLEEEILRLTSCMEIVFD